MFKRFSSVLLASCFLVSSSGCGTIMQGTTQSIGISSTPSGATVKVNNVDKGQTPIIVDLKRKDQHFVKIELPGYMTYETTFTRKTSGWVWGNLVFGGLIGLVIDATAGGMYKLTPEQVQATLGRDDLSSVYKDDELYVAVVMTADPSWEKIGQLKKIN